MKIAVVVLSLTTITFLTLSIFLLKEMIKQWGLLDQHLNRAGLRVVTYHYLGAWQSGHPTGMRNIVLRGEGPFSVLIGFDQVWPVLGPVGWDPFGFARSDEHGVLVINTFHGMEGADFRFLLNTQLASDLVRATSTEADQALTPNVTYPPHWFQR